MLSKETHFRPRDTYRLEVTGWKKIFHANGNQKKAGASFPPLWKFTYYKFKNKCEGIALPKNKNKRRKLEYQFS